MIAKLMKVALGAQQLVQLVQLHVTAMIVFVILVNGVRSVFLVMNA